MEKKTNRHQKPNSEFLNKPLSTLYISSDIESAFVHGFTREDFTKAIAPAGAPQVIFTKKVNFPHKSMYIRDYFQVFGDIVFTTPETDFSKTAGLLGLDPKGKQIISSELGVGGKIIRSGKLVLVPEELNNSEHLDLLRDNGFIVDFLPIPANEEKNLLAMRMGFNKHIDTEINIVKHEDGFVFVVNDDYYQRFKNEVDILAQKYNGEVKIIQSRHEQMALRGVNFVELEDGRVLVPENCWSTRLHLESTLGVERVVPVKVDFSKTTGIAQTMVEGAFTTLYFHGGLRCLTNLM
jgi:hypothetical protein